MDTKTQKKTLKVLLIEERKTSREARKTNIEAMQHDLYEYAVVAVATEAEAQQEIANHSEPFNFLLVDLLLKSGAYTDFGGTIYAEDIDDEENGAKAVQRLLAYHRKRFNEKPSDAWQLRPVVYSAAELAPEQSKELMIKVLCYGAYDFISREPDEMNTVFRSLTDMCELQDELLNTLERDSWGGRALNSNGFGISVIGKHWKIWYCSETNRRLSGIDNDQFLDRVCWMEYNHFDRRTTPCPECPSAIVMDSDQCKGPTNLNCMCTKELYPFELLRERGCSKLATDEKCPIAIQPVPNYTNTRLLTVRDLQPKWVRITATQIRSRSRKRVIGASEAIVDVHELEDGYWDAKQLAGELSVEERLRPVLHLIQWMGYRRSRVFTLSNDETQIVGLTELGDQMTVTFPGFRFPAKDTLLEDFRKGKTDIEDIRQGPGVMAKQLGKQQCDWFLEYLLFDPRKRERILGTLVVDDVEQANMPCARHYGPKDLDALRPIAAYIAHILSIEYIHKSQQALRRHDKSLRHLEEWADKAMNSRREVDEALYQEIAEQLKEILGQEPDLVGFHLRFLRTDGILFLYPGIGHYPAIRKDSELNPEDMNSLSAKCFRNGNVETVKDAQNYPGILRYIEALSVPSDGTTDDRNGALAWLKSIESLGCFPITYGTYKLGTLLVQSCAPDYFSTDSLFLPQVCNVIARVLGPMAQEREREEFFENAAYAFRGPASVLHELARIRWMYARKEDVEDAEGELALAEYLHAKANSFHFETGGKRGFAPIRADINLGGLWKSWCAMFRGMAHYGRKKIQLDIVPVNEMAAKAITLNTDRVLFSEIIFNIFENGLNACRSTVRVSMTMDTEKLVVQMDDDGPGISESAFPHLFERFHEDYESGTNRGFGLGLKWSKNHADLLGITLEPERYGPLGGASFKIVLHSYRKQ